MPKSTPKESPPSFEEAMDELDGIVQAMEGDRLGLADLIEQYARGMKLEKVCRERLDVAKQRVEMITAAAAAGDDLDVVPFDPAEPAAKAPKDTVKADKGRSGAGAKGTSNLKKSEEHDDEIRLF